MEQKPKTSPKDFFLYLGAMIALYISTVSIIALWFRIIDTAFPDPLRYTDPYSTGISIAIASLIVIFPMFLGISWVVHKDESKNSEKRELGVRKWLIYLTLFVAGIVIASDLIVLISRFLSGREITAGFFLKVLVIFVVIGAIFAYYVYKLHKKDGISDKIGKYLTWGTAMVVILSIIVGFVVMGSPQAQRTKRIDGERVSDLQNIQWQIVNYWQKKEMLPTALDDLKDSISGYRAPADPSTDEPYVYRATGERSFELCATFDLSSEDTRVRGERFTIPVKSIYSETWEHGEGETCFEREIDSELYPPREPKVIR